MSPKGEVHSSKGTSKTSWVTGNRFVQHKASGEPEASMPQPFEGLGLIGYDNIKKQYTSIWIDNMGTGIMKVAGKYDQAAKILTESGDYSCPMTGGKCTYRSITTFKDADNYTYETYITDENGEEFRSTIITYSRKQS